MRHLFAPAIALLVCLNPAVGQDDGEKRGHWWYEDPPTEEEVRAPEKPQIPTDEVLKTMHPEDFQELITAQLQFALVDQTEGSVEDYFKLVDFARRQARSFASLHGQVILNNPELNPTMNYPLTQAGRAARTEMRKGSMLRRLQAARGDYGLIMFSLQGCPYCDVQWATLELFSQQTGWQIRRVDMQENPHLALRYGVEQAPVTVMVGRLGGWANVAVGATNVPAVLEGSYRQLRLIEGEADPGQFYTDGPDMGSFFDPSARAELP